MKLRVKCPSCDYKFIINARLTSDTGNATCPQNGCGKVFEWRGPDAPLKKRNSNDNVFEQMFGSNNPFNDLLNGKK